MFTVCVECLIGKQKSRFIETVGVLNQGSSFPFSLCDFVTVDCAVTLSSTGAKDRFKEMTPATSARVSWQGVPGSSLSGTLASYGASAVARTSGQGHVAEEKRNTGLLDSREL